jgi:predicted acetyltransferase
VSDVTLRPVSADEFPAYHRTVCETFHADPRDDEREVELSVFEPERSVAAFDDKDIVGTACIYTRTLTVPGVELPVAAVSFVSVAPTHRRRGILTAMMRDQLSGLHEQQAEPVAALWASEAGIYQRFGYGLASTCADLDASVPAARFRPGVDLGAGRVRMANPEEGRPHVRSVYESARAGGVGLLDRRGRWWDARLADLEHWRSGGTMLRYALYEEPSGQVTGYALYRSKGQFADGQPDSEVTIRELVASEPHAYAALWSYLLSLDLVRHVRWSAAPADLPLLHLVTDPRQLALTPHDQLWVRLADVGRALAARRYAAEVDVVFEVGDEFCPWNAGRWRLSGGPAGASCERTTDAPDLVLTSTELGGAYLGGTTLTALAAAGRVGESRPGALAAASAAFRSDREPWCAEVF